MTPSGVSVLIEISLLKKILSYWKPPQDAVFLFFTEYRPTSLHRHLSPTLEGAHPLAYRPGLIRLSISDHFAAARAVFPLYPLRLPTVRAFACSKSIPGKAYKAGDTQSKGYIGFGYDLVAAIQQFQAHHSPYDQKSDKGYNEAPEKNPLHCLCLHTL